MQNLSYEVPVLSHRYARRFFDFLEQRQVNSRNLPTQQKVFNEVQRNPDGFLTMNEVLSLLRAADELLADEKAAFEFGRQLDLSVHGLFGYSLLNADDPFELTETVVNHISVSLPLLKLMVRRQGHGVVISFEDRWDLGSAKSFIAKIYMGSIYGIARRISREMHFDCQFAASRMTQWRALAPDSDWRFGAQDNRVVIPDFFRVPKAQHETAVRQWLQRTRQQGNERSSGPPVVPQTLAAQVQDHVLNSLRYANIERSAELLDMSPRHLRKRLAEEGTSFREISSDVRKYYANLYLCNTPLSIQDIGMKLGFGDQSSFTRAYQRWTGETPGATRKRSSKDTEGCA